MKRIQTIVALAVLAACTGMMTACGGGSRVSGGNGGGSSPTPDMSGNWALHVTSAYADAYVGGVLTQSGSTLTGVFHVVNSGCYAVLTDVPVTGTISGNTAQLTTASVNGQVLTATLNTSGGSAVTGTYSISGGCGGGDTGQVAGNRIPSYSGEWKGTFQSQAGVRVGVDARITQSAPDAHGWYQISGTATFQGSTCFTQGTVSQSIASGDLVSLAMNTNDTPAGEVDFAGLSDSSGSTLTGQYQISSGACVGDSGSGTLTRQ
jgi:hypothetical protein